MIFFTFIDHSFLKKIFACLLFVFLTGKALHAEETSANTNSDDVASSAVALADDQDDSIRNFKPWLEAPNGTGNWFGVRDQLAKKGIDLGFSSINEVWGNTTGGVKRDSVYTGVIQIATTVDLEKLIDWKGGSFYSRWLYLAGQDPGSVLLGTLMGPSNIGGYSTFRNIELWLQQNMLHDAVSIRAGQLVADAEFVISDYGSLFLNNTFGWPAFLFTSIPNGGPAYPVGAPGVRLKLQPNDQFSWKTAAFQGNVYPQNINNHGFDWNLNANQGYFYLTELAYRYDCILPGQLKVGSWFSSSTFQNFSNPNTSLWGNYGIYGIIDQMIYRCPSKEKKAASSDEKNDKGLGVFSRVAFEPEDRNVVNFYCDTGFNFKGLLPNRDQDLIGLACGYGLLGDDAINTFQQTQGSAPANTIFDIELTYQAQLTPWFSLQPDVQYLIHPGSLQSYPNAFVVGLRASVTF